MDAHPDDLNDLERRLAAWQPAADGLDADRLLFDAGRAAASARSRRIHLAHLVLATFCFVWAVFEHHERLSLERRVRELSAPSPTAPAVPEPSLSPEPPSPHSLLASHRVLDRGLDAWPAPTAPGPESPPAPARPILRAGQTDALLGS
jgi:hypothetical protein